MLQIFEGFVNYCFSKLKVILVLLGILLSSSIFAINSSSSYQTSGDLKKHPLILVSSEQDSKKWKNITNYKLPSDFKGTTASLNWTNCDGKSCIAAGAYETQTNGVRPLILKSADGGESWSSIASDQINWDLGIVPNLSITSVSCNRAVCIIAGYYNNNSKNKPFILRNIAGSNFWNTVKENQIVMPTDFSTGKNTLLMGVQCNDSLCIAVGSYGTANADSNPLILTSTESGEQWIAVNKDNIKLPSGSNKQQLLISISCDRLMCSATGIYQALVDQVNYNYRPLILNSTDGGRKWNGVNLTDMTIPADLQMTRSMRSFCDSTGCIGASFYQNTDISQAGIFNSTADRTVWTAMPTSKIILPRTASHSSTLISATCSDTLCIEIGTYRDSAAAHSIPLILVYDKHKTTWETVEPGNIQLPADLHSNISTGSIAYSGSTFVYVGTYDIVN